MHPQPPRWLPDRRGADTGWVGAALSNYDDFPELGEILQRQVEAITGQPDDPPGGGG